MSNEKRKNRTSVQLNLMDTPKTWFLWKEKEHNVKDAPADIFDAWIRQYVDEIVHVDTTTWEIFQRWGILNAVIDGGFLLVRKREDGSQILEEKSSTLASESEEKSSGELASEAV